MNPLTLLRAHLLRLDRPLQVEARGPRPLGTAVHAPLDDQTREDGTDARPRGEVDPAAVAIAAALGLPATATTEEALDAIERLKRDTARARAATRTQAAQLACRGVA